MFWLESKIKQNHPQIKNPNNQTPKQNKKADVPRFEACFIICRWNRWGTKTLEVSYKDPDLFQPAGAEIFVCLILVFPTLIPLRTRSRVNYTHTCLCKPTLLQVKAVTNAFYDICHSQSVVPMLHTAKLARDIKTFFFGRSNSLGTGLQWFSSHGELLLYSPKSWLWKGNITISALHKILW